MSAQHTPEQWAQRVLARTEKQLARVEAQRGALLEMLESLVVHGYLGLSEPADANVEINIAQIRKAERLCKRTRVAIAKATGSAS